MNIKHISNSAEETLEFADDLARGKLFHLPPKCVFLMLGEVGAGKTTFVRGFASRWGLDENVTSPTFTIINEYLSDKLRILHIDLYRLMSTREAEELGLEDEISQSDYTFIEWPEISTPLLNFNTINIRITQGDFENQRFIEIEFN